MLNSYRAAALAAVVVLSGCAQTSESPAAPASQRVRALAEQAYQRELDLNPVFETLFVGRGPRMARAGVVPTEANVEKQRTLYRDIERELATIPLEGLSETDRNTHEVLARRAQAELARNDFPLRAIQLLNPGRGVHSGLLFLASTAQPLANEAEFEAWLQRVEASTGNFEQAKLALQQAQKKGWTQSRVLVERALGQMQAIAAKPGDQGPLWGPIARYPKDASEAKRADFAKRYRAVLDTKYLPAMREYMAYVRDEYLPQARTTTGIGALPGGDTAYRSLVRVQTTTELTPEKVHEIGLAEVARVRAQMLGVARGLGFRGDIKEFSAWLESNPAVYPFTTPDAVLVYLRGVHARVVPQLPKLFKRVPKAGFEIRLADPEVAASASASYLSPSADGTRPGQFTMPVVDPKRIASFGLTALLLHEGMPGHHLDIGLKRELDLPSIRKVFGVTAYSEGWGLYGESLGHELGVYDDPWALMGRYQGELHRAARLVVDTGMHSKGWTREQAIRYLVEERGQTQRDATVAIERYMSDPGQALAYKIGELEILALRDEAKKKMGARFDIREFHEAVLGEGALPLPLLRRRVEAWALR
ncbi:DUF885 domain-containing protein [Usitatibacter palustris]|uniref:DUF885 domain-containing protein n=1 Tax=Usitatibacter palustris TaxID=2732487 RepID=A0A6M4H3Y8_9PROT|nr:DUF885 domain-containing protein [Usitatibacter palustris]QJR13808.1 hypothetical protein DSM104440_00598 [Usitatibacter palustris]